MLARPKPVRVITIDLGNGIRTISGIGRNGYESFGEIKDNPGNVIGYKDSFSTDVDVSQPGYIIQTTNGESKTGTPVYIVIKTILDENLKPKNQDQAIKDEIDKIVSGNGKYKIEETESFEKVLKNGDKVTVHEVKIGDGTVNVFSYMPDNSTIVTVKFPISSPTSGKLIYQTLNIGEMQNLQ